MENMYRKYDICKTCKGQGKVEVLYKKEIKNGVWVESPVNSTKQEIKKDEVKPDGTEKRKEEKQSTDKGTTVKAKESDGTTNKQVPK